MQVMQIDKAFLMEQVHIRLAENDYKMNNLDKCLEWLEVVEQQIKDRDKYLLHLLRGKVFDKKRQFHNASQEFEIASQIGSGYALDNDVVGNIDFRLGWALVRSKRDIPRGIEKLQHASECIPDNTEILIKLSGVLY